jgi:hypothetical protein
MEQQVEQRDLEWNSRLSSGTPSEASRLARCFISSSDEYDGRSQSIRASPNFLRIRLVVYGHGALA